MICDIRPLKPETHRVILTAGDDKLYYNGNPSSPDAALLDIKIHINSVISDSERGARYLTAGIKN